ncbi:MAG: helix-turn-helix transcriptional regulator [Solirubrobacteraceae bacterium]
MNVAATRQRGFDEGGLLERDRELDSLSRIVQAAGAGEAVTAVIEGPAGIGKSRLLARTREMASAGSFQVLSARGSDLETALPYGIVRQLFDPLLLEPDGRERLLTDSAQAAARVFEPPDADDPSGDGGFGALHGLFWLTATLAADRPLCLSIDDLHWADRASLRFLVYLARRLDGLGVLIATATRMEDSGPEPRLILEIVHDPAAVPIRLAALSEDAVGEMVRERLGHDAEPAFSAACHHATGGNPLLLGELLKTLRAEGVRPDAAHAIAIREIGPRAVARTVLLRIGRLPPDAVAVARAIAVLGDGASLPATASLANLDERSVAEATRALIAAEILRPEPPLGFVHALVRDAVYHELAASERELEHERAAKALADLGAAPEILASHLLVVPPRGERWVADVLLQAGRLASRRGDAASAASYLRRALDERPADEDRSRLLFDLGWQESHVDVPSASEHLREAGELLEDPLQRALAAEILAGILLLNGAADDTVTVVRTAVAELGDQHADQRRALESMELYAVAFGAQVPDAEARLATVRAAGVPVRLGAKLLAAAAAWNWALHGGSARECSEFTRAILADGSLIARYPGFGATIAGIVLVLADDDAALPVWDAAMTGARQHGSLYSICSVNVFRGWTWLQRGELAEAEASLRDAHEQLHDLFAPDAHSVAYGAAHLTRVLTERGDLAGARSALAARGNPNPASDADALVRRAEIELLLAEHSWDEALVLANQYHGRLRGIDNPAWGPWRSLKALALDGLGDRDETRALVEDEVEAARRWGAPGALARALRLLGTLRREDGQDLLREAVSVAEASPARLEHAKALVALGSALRRAGERSESREPLRRGFELATRCGAESLANSARAELHSAGARPRREALSGPESLTPSERRVADLAAEGRSNRDIAQTLFVTPKTVEVHLTSTYRKLGISARVALSAALGNGVT